MNKNNATKIDLFKVFYKSTHSVVDVLWLLCAADMRCSAADDRSCWRNLDAPGGRRARHSQSFISLFLNFYHLLSVGWKRNFTFHLNAHTNCTQTVHSLHKTSNRDDFPKILFSSATVAEHKFIKVENLKVFANHMRRGWIKVTEWHLTLQIWVNSRFYEFDRIS